MYSTSNVCTSSSSRKLYSENPGRNTCKLLRHRQQEAPRRQITAVELTTHPRLLQTCTDSCSSSWPPPERPPSASPGWMRLSGKASRASPRSSGRAGGCSTTTAPGGTEELSSLMTDTTRGSESCRSTRSTPRVRSKMF